MLSFAPMAVVRELNQRRVLSAESSQRTGTSVSLNWLVPHRRDSVSSVRCHVSDAPVTSPSDIRAEAMPFGILTSTNAHDTVLKSNAKSRVNADALLSSLAANHLGTTVTAGFIKNTHNFSRVVPAFSGNGFSLRAGCAVSTFRVKKQLLHVF